MSLTNIAEFLDVLDQQRELITAALVAFENDILASRELTGKDRMPVQLGQERTAEQIISAAYSQKARLSENEVYSLCGKFEDELQRLYAKARIGTGSVPPHLHENWLRMLESLEGAHQKLLNDTLTQCRRVTSAVPLGPELESDSIGCYDLEHTRLHKKARQELAELQKKQNPTYELPVSGDTSNLWSINNFLNTLDQERQRITGALRAYQNPIDVRDASAEWLAYADCLRRQFKEESRFHYYAALSATETMHPNSGGPWRRKLEKLNIAHLELLESPLGGEAEHADWQRRECDNAVLVEDARLELAALHEVSKPIGTDPDATDVKRMSVEEANEKTMKVAKQYGRAFFVMSIRQQAKLIGCHYRTWEKTPFYLEAVADGRIAPAKPKAARADSLTSGREAVIGTGQKDEMLNQAIEQEARKLAEESEMRRLIAESQKDNQKDPSPLENAPPDQKRKLHSRTKP